jgi:peptide chain release factor 1
MNERYEAIEARFEELATLLGDPKVASDPGALARLGKEYSELESRVRLIREIRKLDGEIESVNDLAADTSDPEMAEFAESELSELRSRSAEAGEELRRLLLPKDPHDDRAVIMEIRAGAGGTEAALFAADLVRMYGRSAERSGWKVELLNQTLTELGGVKEVIVAIRGDRAYQFLKHESGVHRVQRVPVTESSGRLHTSAASVVVLPEAQEIDVKIDEDDIRVDVFRSSGHGGQSVNTTDSAVRITHLPTGLIVSIQDEKSQHKNRAKAMAILRSRLLDLERQKQDADRGDSRRSQIGGGDRSAKMRTYNFPQDRVTDHRISKTLYGVEAFLDGEIDELIQALIETDEAERLVSAGV